MGDTPSYLDYLLTKHVWLVIHLEYASVKRQAWELTERAYIKLTISTSEGMRDRKSASSLLSTAFGLRIFFVNLFIPVETAKRLTHRSYTCGLMSKDKEMLQF